ncbi:MAG: ABC transporter permease [Proteobacteria bacterium]|nr:ABC transporter permease [Pseudomonadota bacterium]
MTDSPLPRKPGLGERWAAFWDSDIAWSFRHSPLAIIAALVVAIIFVAAIFGPWFAPQNPFDPSSLNLMDGKTPPMTPNAFTGTRFLFGTDDQGRDVFSTILYGSRVSILVGFAAVALAMGIGVTLGLIAGYRGGWVESFIMRVADIQLTFPSILVALMIFGIFKGFFPAGSQNDLAVPVLIIAIGLSDWPQYARTVRGVTMVERSKDYVSAARIIGQHPARIMARHVLPNVLGPVLVIATLGLALAIIAEATLSYLGVGVPPTQPSLGTLIKIGQEYVASGEWWILLFPSLTLLALALSVNILGDWLRDALNPRLR